MCLYCWCVPSKCKRRACSGTGSRMLLDNTPDHGREELCSGDGRIRMKFLVLNRTSVIQPLDQGIILACNHYCRQHMLDLTRFSLTIIPEGEEDRQGAKTLDNIKSYYVKDAVYNLQKAQDMVKVLTLRILQSLCGGSLRVRPPTASLPHYTSVHNTLLHVPS